MPNALELLQASLSLTEELLEDVERSTDVDETRRLASLARSFVHYSKRSLAVARVDLELRIKN